MPSPPPPPLAFLPTAAAAAAFSSHTLSSADSDPASSPAPVLSAARFRGWASASAAAAAGVPLAFQPPPPPATGDPSDAAAAAATAEASSSSSSSSSSLIGSSSSISTRPAYLFSSWSIPSISAKRWGRRPVPSSSASSSSSAPAPPAAQEAEAESTPSQSEALSASASSLISVIAAATTPSAAGAGSSPPRPAKLKKPRKLTPLIRRWSCEPCRTRKIKCDGVRPICGLCVKRGLPESCLFLGLKEKEKPASDLVDENDEYAASNGLTAPCQQPPGSEEENFSKITFFPPDDEPLPPEDHPLTVLPLRPGADPLEQEILTEAFFSSRYMMIRIVHKKSFLDNLNREPLLLRAAICAYGALDPAMVNFPMSVLTWYIDIARSQVPTTLDLPCIKHLQGLLILGMASAIMGKIELSRIHYGMAIRLGHYLQVEVDPDELPYSISPIEKELRRRLWWRLFLSEQYLSSTLTRPAGIIEPRDISIRPKLPCSDADWYSTDPNAVSAMTPMPVGNHLEAYHSLIKLQNESLQAAAILNSCQSPATERNQEYVFREIRAKLEGWRRSTDPNLILDINDIEGATARLASVTKGGSEWSPPERLIDYACFYHSTVLALALPFVRRYLSSLLSMVYSASERPEPRTSLDDVSDCWNAMHRQGHDDADAHPRDQSSAAERLARLHGIFVAAIPAARAIATLCVVIRRSGMHLTILSVLPVVLALDFLSLANAVFALAAMPVTGPAEEAAFARVGLDAVSVALAAAGAGVAKNVGGRRSGGDGEEGGRTAGSGGNESGYAGTRAMIGAILLEVEAGRQLMPVLAAPYAFFFRAGRWRLGHGGAPGHAGQAVRGRDGVHQRREERRRFIQVAPAEAAIGGGGDPTIWDVCARNWIEWWGVVNTVADVQMVEDIRSSLQLASMGFGAVGSGSSTAAEAAEIWQGPSLPPPPPLPLQQHQLLQQVFSPQYRGAAGLQVALARFDLGGGGGEQPVFPYGWRL
ncbi:fungal-specific transcription factor domain-containing protein [Zopfochytrium polystomum]|nr:fungal-specific transcription factor domain-containing protein [Zopfochytrium polystomum]